MPIVTGNVLARPRPELADAYYQMEASGGIADKVFPPLAVETKTGQLEVLKRESLNSIENLVRAPDGSYARTNAYIGKLDYDCEEIGAEHVLLDGDGKTISYNRELGGVTILRSKIDTKKEASVVATLMTGWTGATGAASVSWATAESAVPIDDIVSTVNTIMLNSGVRPNALILNPVVLQMILAAASTRDRFPGAPMVTQGMLEQSLALLTGLQYVLVGEMVYNTADEGAAFTGGFIWPSTDVMICRIAADAGPTNPLPPSTGRTPVWIDDAPVGDTTIESYRDETRRGMVLRARTNFDHVIMDAATGLKLSVTKS